ncbi:MAG: tetratricopeptide repeat protein [Dissulfurispiraceae bacterium]|jgi:tetratricopeptide (TPR) repeat protein|nr:tetratricopeptide repeat protein [Dissulfurispiraceae bacterium]
MSLLADLLSKVKTDNKAGREVPPSLKKVVYNAAEKKLASRKIMMLTLFIAVAVAAGVLSVLFFEKYLFKQTEQIIQSKPVSQSTQKTDQLPVMNYEQVASEQTDMHNAPEIKEAATEKQGSEYKQQSTASKKDNFIHTAELKHKAEAAHQTPLKTEAATEPVKSGQQPLPSPTERSEQDFKKQAPAPEQKSSDAAPKQHDALIIKKDIAPKSQTLTAGSGYNTNIDIYLYTAKNHESRKEYQKALENYKKALDLSPNNYIIMNNIAGVLLQNGSYHEAISFSKESLRIKKDYVPSLINLGLAHIKSGNESEGEGYLSKAVSIEPDNSNALLNLAILQEKRKEHDRAYNTFFRLASSGKSQGWIGMARILERQGRHKEAANLYREILGMDKTSSDEKKSVIERLQQID